MIYADDTQFPGGLAGKILGSPVAHGRIRRLDTRKAEQLPGVRAVVTAKDAPTNRYGGIVRDKLVFASDVVRYHGDPIAAVAADSIDIAEEALHLIEVDIDPLPVVLDPKEAAESTTMIHEQWEGYTALPNLVRHGNVSSSGRVQWGDVEQGFAQSDYVYEARFEIAMAHQVYIEPRSSAAKVEADDGRGAGRRGGFARHAGQIGSRVGMAQAQRAQSRPWGGGRLLVLTGHAGQPFAENECRRHDCHHDWFC